MRIHIALEDLVSEYVKPFKNGMIRDVHIDYYTNALHGFLGDQEVIIFRFRDCGWIADNRTGKVRVESYPTVGIMLHTSENAKAPEPVVEKYTQLKLDL